MSGGQCARHFWHPKASGPDGGRFLPKLAAVCTKPSVHGRDSCCIHGLTLDLTCAKGGELFGFVQKLPDALRRQRFGACELRVGFGIDKTGASQKELKYRFAGDVRTDLMPGRDGAGKESRVFSAGRLEAAVFQTRMKGMLKALPVNLDGFDGFRESL